MMEKYGISATDLKKNLWAEEKILMQKIASLRAMDHKIASDEVADLSEKLSQVRQKLLEVEGGN